MSLDFMESLTAKSRGFFLAGQGLVRLQSNLVRSGETAQHPIEKHPERCFIRGTDCGKMGMCDNRHFPDRTFIRAALHRKGQKVCDMEQEQRRRTRVPIQLEATLMVADQEMAVKSQNLSLKGLLCTVDRPLHPGQRCLVKLKLTPGVQVLVQGEVLRAGGEGMAIDFLEMDEQSFVHLKKIVEYNAGDADLIDDELVKPAFTRPSTGGE
jgi:hypothetical protein